VRGKQQIIRVLQCAAGCCCPPPTKPKTPIGHRAPGPRVTHNWAATRPNIPYPTAQPASASPSRPLRYLPAARRRPVGHAHRRRNTRGYAGGHTSRVSCRRAGIRGRGLRRRDASWCSAERRASEESFRPGNTTWLLPTSMLPVNHTIHPSIHDPSVRKACRGSAGEMPTARAQREEDTPALEGVREHGPG
jgi:hypothetical protein